MIRDLFVNIALLTVFIFFAGQWFLKADSETRALLRYKLMIGGIMGVFGIVLLYAGIHIDGNNMLDLRHQTVFAAAALGGLPASLTACLLIVIGRMIMDFSSSFPAVITGVLVAVSAGIISNKVPAYGKKWTAFLSVFVVIFVVDLSLIFSFSFIDIVLPFLLMNILCGVFVAAFLHHLKHSNGLIEQVQNVQKELLDILHLQPGFTFKFRKEQGRFIHTMAEGQLLYQIGIVPTDIVGHPYVSGMHLPEDTAKYMFGHYERAWSGERVMFEVTFKGYTALVTLEPILSRNGQVKEVICGGVNITERKNAEKTLVENELRYRTLVDSLEDMIFGFDEQGVITSANQKIVDMLGIPFKHIIGRTFVELFSSKHKEEWEQYFNRALHERRRIRFELDIQLPLSTALNSTYSVTLSPVFGEDASFTSLTCTIHDLTDIIKKKEADEANLAKSEFLARMSHEIRTPLSGIIGITELLGKTQLTANQQNYLKKIQSSSHALLHIINEILDFSKVEAGKLRLDEQRFYFMDMIQRLSGTISIFMGKQQIEFVMDTPDGMPDVLIGDSLRLEQVLLNLCGNAIKFTDKGLVTLRITKVCPEWREPSSKELKLRFEVEDTGIGISQEQIGHLFQPFSQADGSTSRKYGGTGLGLVISKSLIGLLGGELSVDSVLGKGSRFSFELHFQLPEDAKVEPYQLARSHKGSRVMVLEDSALVYEQLQAALGALQLQPVRVKSWKDAMMTLAHTDPNDSWALILADMEMDDMYGIDTWQALKEAAMMTDTLTIAMTSVFGREELIGLEAASRPDATLVKPISRYNLLDALQAVLDHPKTYTSPNRNPHAIETKAPSKKSSGRILLAEDNEINELVATELLKEWGYKVEVAHNGLEVLQKLQQGEWDLVLMDIHMPEMDGYEATRRIRANTYYDDMPIIALTANVIKSNQDTFYRIGMNDIITKPIDVEVMRLTVRKWLTPEPAAMGSLPGIGSNPQLSLAAAAALPSLNGIHVGQALHRLDGKVMILIHLLKKFEKEYHHFVTDLNETIEQGEMEVAKRMLHTLRGASGNLSALDLLAAATELEVALEDKPASDDHRILLDRLNEEHLRVLESIRSLKEE